MKKISVAIATYNEEKDIGPCLESVRGIADEIVVVDGSSTDKTRQVAESLGARVIKTTNKPMFHINKNMAISACKGDWVLQLDADERVSSELADEIKRVTQKSSGPAAYWLKRKNFFLGKFLKKGGQYPDPVIRLFQKGKARLPEKSVHEQMEVEGRVGYLENDLIHLGTPTLSRYFLREKRYANLEALGMYRQKTPVNPFTIVKYFVFLPIKTFFSIFIRHKGFVDSWRGFLFAAFSGMHYSWAFSRYLKLKLVKVRQ